MKSMLMQIFKRLPIHVGWNLFFVFGFYIFSSLYTSAYTQDIFGTNPPSIEQVRYSEIREAVKQGNYSLAENLIQRELDSRQGDPELEYYQVDLWLRKANDLYEKEQYKSALDYYMKVFHSWPNHPTVRERIERWKDKKPYNRAKQSSKSKSIQKNNDPNGLPYPLEMFPDSDRNKELLLLQDRLDRNNERLETFLSIVYIVLGFLIAICILLLGITIKLSGNPKSNPSGKVVSGGNK